MGDNVPERRIVQEAPWPDELDWLVKHCRYKVGKGWQYDLFEDSTRDPESYDANGWPVGRVAGGTTVEIRVTGQDSYHDDRTVSVRFIFPVPAATFNRASWRRWLFDRIGDVELHERMEDFRFEDDDGTIDVPYAPHHGPGEDPYIVHELSSKGQRAMSFRGDLNPA